METLGSEQALAPCRRAGILWRSAGLSQEAIEN
jgi:hypothetical protein